ncbi:OmpA family protein [Spartinivicinus ruber]|uniref:OmpA family protein n=1 Tax=Spartinivicinus ruber TaxID=2683272 RepID=UPI0013D5F5B8|nr:OmpA family protein [Spartinivicinus ruber]
MKKVNKDRVYLLSASVDKSGNPEGEVSLQPNVLLAKESMVFVERQKYDKGELTSTRKYDKEKAKKQPVLLQTDEIGAIVTIVAAEDANTNKKEASKLQVTVSQEKVPCWKIGEPINIYAKNKEEAFFFPPLSAASYIYAGAKPGEKTWAETMVELFDKLDGGFNGKAVKLKAVEVPVKKVTSDSKVVRMREPDQDKIRKKDESELKYQDWYKQYNRKTIRGFLIPYYQVILVVFSNMDYVDTIVELLDKNGKPIGVRKNVEPLATANTTMYVAFIVSESKLPPDFYQLKIIPSEQAWQRIKKTSYLNKIEEDGFYILKEKFRFGIKKPIGEFEIINGDPFSVEESLVKQFPNLYANRVMVASDRGDVPEQKAKEADHGPEGIETALHSYNVAKGYTDLATGILGADGPKAWAMLIISNLKAISTDSNFNTAIDLITSGNDLVSASRDFLDLVNPATRDLPDFRQFATRAWWISDPSYNQTFAHTVRIPERFMVPVMRGLSVAGTVASVFSLFNDIKGVSDSLKKGSSTTSDWIGAVKAYDEHIAVPVEETEDKQKIEAYQQKLEEIIQSGVETQLIEDKTDGSLYLNVVFPFDQSSTEFDRSLNQLAEAMEKLPYLSITLKGHACPKGPTKYNLTLSERRAKTVQEKLLGISSKIKAHRVNVIGVGEQDPIIISGKVDYEKSRRVVAVIPKFPLNYIYPPSREGTDMLEKFRAKAVATKAEIDEKIVAAAESALDTVLGVLSYVPGVQLYAIGIKLLKDGVKALCSVMDELNNILHGHGVQEAKKLFNHYQELDYVNQIHALENSSKENEYFRRLYIQFHIRAMALNGLVGLLFRASIYATSKGGSAGQNQNYEEALEKFFVKEYIQTYVLSDDWYADFNAVVPVGLDEYWATRVQMAEIIDVLTGGSISKKHLMTEWASDDVANQKSFVVKAMETAQGIHDIYSPVDLKSGGGAGFASFFLNRKSTYYIHGASYIGARFNAPVDLARKADFQQYFPIHYIDTSSMTGLMQSFRTDFAFLDYNSYEYTCIYVRDRFSKNDNDWKPLHKYGAISPYHQLRIIVVLKQEVGEELKKLDLEGTTYILPAEFQPTRCDWWNMKGPKQATWVRKLSSKDLRSEDKTKEVLEMLNKDCLYGVIYHPSYQYGSQVILGVKPLASKFFAERRKEYKTFFGAWWMDYFFEVTLGNNSSTRRYIRVSGQDYPKGHIYGEDTSRLAHEVGFSFNSVFHVTLDPEREYKHPGSKGAAIKDEHLLLDPDFLAIGEQGFEYPELFDNPEAHLLIRLKGQKHYIYPNASYIKALGYNNVRYDDDRPINTAVHYNWASPIEIVVLVVCDELKLESYKNQNINWKNIPAKVTLEEVNSGNEGPSFGVQLEHVGEIVREGRGEKSIKWRIADINSVSSAARDVVQGLTDSAALTVISDLEEDPLSQAWGFSLFGLMMGEDIYEDKTKQVYMARIIPEYTNFTGKKVQALRPFGITYKHWNFNLDSRPHYYSDPNKPIMPNAYWGVKAKISTTGNSGLKNEDINGEFELTLPNKMLDMERCPWVQYKDLKQTKKDAEWYLKNEEQAKQGGKTLKVNKSLDVEFYLKSVKEKKQAIYKWLTEDSTKMVIRQDYFE